MCFEDKPGNAQKIDLENKEVFTCDGDGTCDANCDNCPDYHSTPTITFEVTQEWWESVLKDSTAKEILAVGDCVSRADGCRGMTEEEEIICKQFLHDADKTHSCNEYKLLMNLIEQKSILDKIRSEIEQLPITEHLGTHKIYIDADDFKENVLAILDKYKEESEN